MMTFVGPGDDGATFVVPAGVTEIAVTVLGAQGGTCGASSGGLGGSVEAILAVTPGDTLGMDLGAAGGGCGGTPGNGGGAGGAPELMEGSNAPMAAGAPGGGATDFDNAIIAGGGGGAGGQLDCAGGVGAPGGGVIGGWPGGTQCAPGSEGVPYGPTSPHGGALIGFPGVGGQGGDGGGFADAYPAQGPFAGGGGGGAGYYGGAGGTGGSCDSREPGAQGGGGGSGYAYPQATNVVMTAGVNPGYGKVVVRWFDPGSGASTGGTTTVQATTSTSTP